VVDKVEELRGVGVMKEEVEGLDDGERGEARQGVLKVVGLMEVGV